MILGLWAAATLQGCSESANLSRDLDEVPGLDSEVLAAAIQVDVLPAAQDPTVGVSALPTSLSREFSAEDPSDVRVDLGLVSLPTPILVSGEILALRTNPTIATLPTVAVAVQGTVRLSIPGTIASFSARTDGAGRFESFATADGEYQLAVVPDDPLVPTWVGPLGDPTAFDTLDLGQGVPIYGLVTRPGGPAPGVVVQATSPDGVSTPVAVTDDTGFYQLRVSPGVWSVTTEVRPGSSDPRVTLGEVTVGADGSYVPLALPDPEAVLAGGIVTRPNGDPEAGAVVRFRSTRLPAYDALGLEGFATAEVTASNSGEYLVRLVPGVYEVDVIPPSADDGSVDLGPRTIAGVVVDGDIQQDVSLPALRSVSGVVLDPEGSPVAEARLACQVLGFDQHEYVAFSRAGGRIDLDAPTAPMVCELGPPGSRPDLALSRISRTGTETGGATFRLVAGVELVGTVEAEAGPEAGSLVQIRNRGGDLMGFDVTDETGAFSVRVDPALAN